MKDHTIVERYLTGNPTVFEHVHIQVKILDDSTKREHQRLPDRDLTHRLSLP